MRCIKTENDFGCMCYPLNHIPDCSYWKYALQLNVYRFILETEYELNVSAMFLAVVHPSITTPRILEVPRMDPEVRANHNFEIENGRANVSSPGALAPFLV